FLLFFSRSLFFFFFLEKLKPYYELEFQRCLFHIPNSINALIPGSDTRAISGSGIRCGWLSVSLSLAHRYAHQRRSLAVSLSLAHRYQVTVIVAGMDGVQKQSI